MGMENGMLNEEKVVLMSKMAIYEKKEGKNDFKVSKYYRTDYVGLNLINTALIATLLYMIIVASIILINIESIMKNISGIDLLSVGRRVLIWYTVFLAFYLVVAYVIYNIRYKKAKTKIKRYDEDLKKLYKIYKEERKNKAGILPDNK